jgi:hypothetical protein
VRLIVDWGEIFSVQRTRAAVYSSDKKVAEVIKKDIRKVFFPSSQGKNRRKI